MLKVEKKDSLCQEDAALGTLVTRALSHVSDKWDQRGQNGCEQECAG
jgi:hypothetical protein